MVGLVPALQNRIGNLAWIVRQAQVKVVCFMYTKKANWLGPVAEKCY